MLRSWPTRARPSLWGLGLPCSRCWEPRLGARRGQFSARWTEVNSDKKDMEPQKPSLASSKTPFWWFHAKLQENQMASQILVPKAEQRGLRSRSFPGQGVRTSSSRLYSLSSPFLMAGGSILSDPSLVLLVSRRANGPTLRSPLAARLRGRFAAFGSGSTWP